MAITRLFRFWLGRNLVHLGLMAFPPGLVKSELYELLNSWSRLVTEVVKASRERLP